MSRNFKPKREILAYCALAQRLSAPGTNFINALTPFLAEACKEHAGELFDAQKFSDTIKRRYGIHIPRLVALGLAEQLHQNGFLIVVSSTPSIVYKYADTLSSNSENLQDSVTEAEVEKVLSTFAEYCAKDEILKDIDRDALDSAFLDRLLHIDSMRMLSRREASPAIKASPGTLLLGKPDIKEDVNHKRDLHLDFVTSQFLLDLKENSPTSFELVSSVAFANMAAEAIACFREPPSDLSPLDTLTVILDSPLLLDMLGVNTEYAEYGTELLETIRASGAKAVVLDHCVVEAEVAISARLAALRSGINDFSTRIGVSAKVDLLNALSNKVGDRAFNRLGIEVKRDPEVSLHRYSQVAVGNIEAEMNERMKNWRNIEAKEHDRKSVWSMLSIRDSNQPCPKICDSKWIFLTRNSALVNIGNNAWATWLSVTTKHSASYVENWAPISMSDKQFAGYVWLRTGGGKSSIPLTRLLANCSAAVRPRADIKAKAYNLVIQLSGKQEADDIAALFEDREGGKALMRATHGDPEDVTPERLPFILETVKLEAGEFAAARVREESERALQEARAAYANDVERVLGEAKFTEELQNEAILKVQEESLRHHADKLQTQQALENERKEKEAQQLVIVREALRLGKNRRQLIIASVITISVVLFIFLNVMDKLILPSLTVGSWLNRLSLPTYWLLVIMQFVLSFWFIPDVVFGRYAKSKERQVAEGYLRKFNLTNDHLERDQISNRALKGVVVSNIFTWHKELSMLEKFGFWGSMASIVSLALYFFPPLASSQPEQAVQVTTSGAQSPAIGENKGNVTINYGAPSMPHEKTYVLRNKVNGATLLISRPSLDAATDPKNHVCMVPGGTPITLTGESAKMGGIDMWRKVKVVSGECANKSGWVAIENVSLE